MASKFRLLLILAVAFMLPFVLASSAFAANESTTYARVFVTNSAPTIQSISITPDPADPGQTISIKVNITDPNGVPDDFDGTGYVNATLDMATPGNGGDDVELALAYNATSDLYETTYNLAVDADPGTWNVSVVAEDDFGSQDTDSNTFTVNTVISLALTQDPIDFGNTSIPVTERRADNGTAGNGYEGGTIKGYPLVITNDGNVDEDLSILGEDLIGQTAGSYSLDVSSITYNTTATTPGTALTISNAEFAASVAKQTSQNLYFWLTISENVPEQEYKGDVTISATQA